MTEQVIIENAEGSFASKWEKFVADNNLSPEVAEKLRGVFYGGAMAIFDELHIATPVANVPKEIHRASLIFQALHDEVSSFWSNADVDEELDVLFIQK